MAVTLPPAVLDQYQRFSLYNSPYPAHDEGHAIDLYPGTPADGRTTVAPSPVGGTVRESRTVRAPTKPYAPEHDHLLAIDCDGPPELAGYVVRVLHVDPAVEPGEVVSLGDDLGTLVRAGFFAPWVDNHLHVGVRPPDRDPIRASGSLPLELGVDVRSLAWDGTGRVVETGETYATLDAPAHPNPGREFVGVRADGGGERTDGSRPSLDRRSNGGEPSSARRASSAPRTGGVLDGGLPHYDGGGLLAGRDGPVALAGDRLGVADGRTVAWDDVTVTANGEAITGLSFFCARDADFGAKLICPEREFDVGDEVRVRIRSNE